MIRCAALALMLVLGSLGAAEAAKLSEETRAKLMRAITGSFAMERNPRPWSVLLIIDQAGNRYPSYWCGSGLPSRIAFSTEVSSLDHSTETSTSGGMLLLLTNPARKWGMDDVLPGGAWLKPLQAAAEREQAKKQRDPKATAHGIAIAISGFTGFSLRGIKEGSLFVEGKTGLMGALPSGRLIDVEAAFTGSMQVLGRQAPIAGKALLTFLEATPAFRMEATFPVPGGELGLSGKAAEGLVATLHAHTSGSTRDDAPEVGADGGLDLKE